MRQMRDAKYIIWILKFYIENKQFSAYWAEQSEHQPISRWEPLPQTLINHSKRLDNVETNFIFSYYELALKQSRSFFILDNDLKNMADTPIYPLSVDSACNPYSLKL